MKTGGPAFPARYVSSGMFLRDWFAAQALTSILAIHEKSQQPPAQDSYGNIGGVRGPDYAGCAEAAYGYADAMLAEREKAVVK